MKLHQAAYKVLLAADRPLHPREVYERILAERLFHFGAQDPISVVASTLRRRSAGAGGVETMFEKIGTNLYKAIP